MPEKKLVGGFHNLLTVERFTMPKITKTHLAAEIGISRTAVHRYAKQGMPVDSIEAAQGWRSANVRARINTDMAFTLDSLHDRRQLSEARIMRTAFEAQLSKLRCEQKRDSLINRVGCELAVSNAFRLFRDSILGVPDHMALGHAQRREFRRALEDALNDAATMMPSLLGKSAEATGTMQP